MFQPLNKKKKCATDKRLGDDCCVGAMNMNNAMTVENVRSKTSQWHKKLSDEVQYTQDGQQKAKEQQRHYHHRRPRCTNMKAMTFLSRQPIKRPVFLGPSVHSSFESLSSTPASFSSFASCTTSDFYTVEQELKELLGGYHQIIKNACGNTQPREETVQETARATSTTATVTQLNINTVPSVDDPPHVGSNNCSGVMKNSSYNTAERGSGIESVCNVQVQQSVISLPVSSVRGDRSTDANTPMPCGQMQQNSSSLKNSPDGGKDASCAVKTGPVTRAEGTAANDDLFADALTEDQLNRSFEMQWHQTQQVQQLCKDFCRGVPSLKLAQNNLDGTLLWDSCTLTEDDMSYPAMRRAAGSPLPPFVNRNWRNIDGSREKNVSYHGSYDSRVYTAYHHQDALSPHERPLLRDLDESRGLNGKAVEVPQRETFFLECDAHNEDVGNGHLEANGHVPCNDVLTVPHDKTASRPQRRRNASRYRRQVVGSTTPEIATSARRTENPSMRSGATGRKGTPLTTRKMPAHIKYNSMEALWGVGANNESGDHDENCEGAVHSETISLAVAVGAVTNSMDEVRRNRQRSRRHSRHVLGVNENVVQGRLSNAANRFHAMVERRVAALEAGVHSTVPLPSFADSLVGAAISGLYPAVKRRLAQLKESQHAEAAAAAAADASLTRSTYRGIFGTPLSFPSTTSAPSTDIRSSRDFLAHTHSFFNARLPPGTGRN